jgi:hypothetical protein
VSALSEADLAVVREALEDLRAAPPPRDLAPIGCVVGLPGVLLLLVLPIAGRRLGLQAGAATLVVVAGIVLLAVGLALWYAAPGQAHAHAVAAAEAALRRLEAWDLGAGDRREALRAATLLVRSGHSIHGATPRLAVDPQEARVRLGAMVALVEAVEEALLDAGGALPLFTSPRRGPEGAGGAG